MSDLLSDLQRALGGSAVQQIAAQLGMVGKLFKK